MDGNFSSARILSWLFICVLLLDNVISNTITNHTTDMIASSQGSAGIELNQPKSTFVMPYPIATHISRSYFVHTLRTTLNNDISPTKSTHAHDMEVSTKHFFHSNFLSTMLQHISDESSIYEYYKFSSLNTPENSEVFPMKTKLLYDKISSTNHLLPGEILSTYSESAADKRTMSHHYLATSLPQVSYSISSTEDSIPEYKKTVSKKVSHGFAPSITLQHSIISPQSTDIPSDNLIESTSSFDGRTNTVLSYGNNDGIHPATLPLMITPSPSYAEAIYQTSTISIINQPSHSSVDARNISSSIYVPLIISSSQTFIDINEIRSKSNDASFETNYYLQTSERVSSHHSKNFHSLPLLLINETNTITPTSTLNDYNAISTSLPHFKTSDINNNTQEQTSFTSSYMESSVTSPVLYLSISSTSSAYGSGYSQLFSNSIIALLSSTSTHNNSTEPTGVTTSMPYLNTSLVITKLIANSSTSALQMDKTAHRLHTSSIFSNFTIYPAESTPSLVVSHPLESNSTQIVLNVSTLIPELNLGNSSFVTHPNITSTKSAFNNNSELLTKFPTLFTSTAVSNGSDILPYSTQVMNYTTSKLMLNETLFTYSSDIIAAMSSSNLGLTSITSLNSSAGLYSTIWSYNSSSTSIDLHTRYSPAIEVSTTLFIHPTIPTASYNQSVSSMYNNTNIVRTSQYFITTQSEMIQSSFIWLNSTTDRSTPMPTFTQSNLHTSLSANYTYQITSKLITNDSITQTIPLLPASNYNYTSSSISSVAVVPNVSSRELNSLTFTSQQASNISYLSSTSATYNITSNFIYQSWTERISRKPDVVTSMMTQSSDAMVLTSSSKLSIEPTLIYPRSISVSYVSKSSSISVAPPITHIPTTKPPPLSISLLDKSKTELEFSINLNSYGLSTIDKIEVVAQRINEGPDGADDSGLLPLTWYKVNYYPKYKYRSYITQVYVLLGKIINQRHKRQRRGVTHLATPKDGVLYIRIGDEKRCQQQSSADPCNGPLIAGESYRFQLLIYRVNIPNPTETGYSLPLQTQPNKDTGDHTVTPSELTPTSIVIICVIVLILLLVIVLIIVGIIVWRRRSSSRTLHTIEMDGKCSLLRKCKKQGNTVDRVHNFGYILDDQQVLRPTSKGLARPVSVKDFYHWVTRSSADSDFRFAEEFESIRDIGRDKTHDASDMAENRGKNRYVNVLAYDHTRVKLSYTDDEAGSDYINANYIHGYKQPRAYIATQGPLPGTTDDFWRMVWEQDSHVIVMVTQCVERGRVKCHPYWPTVEPTLFGDISVSLLSEYAYPDWIEREFLLENEGEEPRTVHHLQYSSWPDHGVPKSQTSIIDFVRAVRSYGLPNHGPMIIHCSAGVGRTGTFIAIDMIMLRLCDEPIIDIYGTICLMRMQRCSMVQTEDQYIFIHRAILEYLQSKENDEPLPKSYTLLPNVPNDSQLDFTVAKEERESDPFSSFHGNLEEKESNEKTAFLQGFSNQQSETIA